MRQFPKNFLDAIKSPECTLFIGSGISMWSGLPHWGGLLNQMVDFLVERGLPSNYESEIKDVINKGDLLTAASLCRQKMRKADFGEFIDRVFKSPSPIPNEIHNMILNLGPTCFITTNYDELIEDAFFVKFNNKLDVINNDQPIEQVKLNKSGKSNFIFKIHGSINSIKTIILSREDYRTLINDNKSTIQVLNCMFAARPIVYVGFGLRDPDFLILKDEISSTFHGAEREHFAIMADVGELEIEYWKKEYGINIISYNTKEEENFIENKVIKTRNHKNLKVLLAELLEQINTGQKEQTRPEQPEQDGEVLLKSNIIRYCETFVQMFNKQEDLRIPLTANYRYDLTKEIKTNNAFHKENIPLLDIFNTSFNLVMIGAPGTGKTFSIQNYGVLLAKEALIKFRTIDMIRELDMKHSIPVILPMKEYNGDIRKMIVSRLPPKLDVDLALKKGWITLIFDAVDEAPMNYMKVNSDVLLNNIQWLTTVYPNNRFIFTSRSMNYVSFLDYPIYELQPINLAQLGVAFEDDLKSPSYNKLSSKMKKILLNPLYLNLYNQVHQKNNNIEDVKDLIDAYLHSIEQDLNYKYSYIPINLTDFLASIAYELVERGIQGLSSEEFLLHLKRHFSNDEATDFLNTLLKLNILVSDIDGNISFFHKTITEYLAAFELVKVFNKNPFIVEEKMKLLNWDEILILFIGLLEKGLAKSVLNKIAEKDIIFAIKVFNGSALKDQEIGIQLFNTLNNHIQSSSISKAERESLSYALQYIGEYGN